MQTATDSTVPMVDDCNDRPAGVPTATEVYYDGVDQNYDGLSDFDQDMMVLTATSTAADCNDSQGPRFHRLPLEFGTMVWIRTVWAARTLTPTGWVQQRPTRRSRL